MLFKMALLGYLYGLPSERRLVEESRVNLAYRWFIGYDLDEAIPDPSVLSKARRFAPTVYEAFFTEMVRRHERAGLIRGDQLFLDSTLVAALAGLVLAAVMAGAVTAHFRAQDPIGTSVPASILLLLALAVSAIYYFLDGERDTRARDGPGTRTPFPTMRSRPTSMQCYKERRVNWSHAPYSYRLIRKAESVSQKLAIGAA